MIRHPKVRLRFGNDRKGKINVSNSWELNYREWQGKRVNTRMALPLGMLLAIIAQLFLFTELSPVRKLATTSLL